MSLLRPFLFSLLLAGPALAQDTAGSWAPTFTARHGNWDVTCDAKGETSAMEQRCYMRYIDVYSRQPSFGVLFLFLEMKDGAPQIALGREFETDLVASSLQIAPGWDRPEMLCTGGPCEISGPDAFAFVDAMMAGGTLEVGFTDAQGTDQLRAWPADGFIDAFNDVAREATARGL